MDAINTNGLCLETINHSTSSLRLVDHVANGSSSPASAVSRIVTHRVHAVSDVSQIDTTDGIDVVFILVKSPQTRVAAAKVDLVLICTTSVDFVKAQKLLVGSTWGSVVTLQNGAGNAKLIRNVMSESSETANIRVVQVLLWDSDWPSFYLRTSQGVTDHGALVVSPGVVRHTGQGSTTLALDPDEYPLQEIIQ